MSSLPAPPSVPPTVTYVRMDEDGNPVPVDEGICFSVPVHTGKPVKYGPIQVEGEEEHRGEKVRIGFLVSAEEENDLPETDCDSFPSAPHPPVPLQPTEPPSPLHYPPSTRSLSFDAVKTTLLPVDGAGRRVADISEMSRDAELRYVSLDDSGNALAVTLGGAPETLGPEELDYGLSAPDAASTPLRPPSDDHLELYSHTGAFDGVFENGLGGKAPAGRGFRDANGSFSSAAAPHPNLLDLRNTFAPSTPPSRPTPPPVAPKPQRPSSARALSPPPPVAPKPQRPNSAQSPSRRAVTQPVQRPVHPPGVRYVPTPSPTKPYDDDDDCDAATPFLRRDEAPHPLGDAPLALAESFADMDLDSSRGTPVHRLDERASSSEAVPDRRTPERRAPDRRPNGVAPPPPPPRLTSPVSLATSSLTSPATPSDASSSFVGAGNLHSPDTQAPEDPSVASFESSPGEQPVNGVVTAGERRCADRDNNDAYRDPTLEEVVEYLRSGDDRIKANAGAYLQHLMYKNEDMKNDCRESGGVAPLLQCLRSADPLVRKNASKALKNLTHKDRNNAAASDANKVAVFQAGGVPILAGRLKTAADPQERGLVAAVLWNLSACEEIKPHLLEDPQVLVNVVDGILLPRARFNRELAFNATPVRGLSYPEDLKNSTGILRNLSSAGGRDPDVRTKLRMWPGLVDSVVRVLASAVEDSRDSDSDNLNFSPINNKVVENCACTLRNLSYRVQEARDGPDYDEDRDGAEARNNASTTSTSSRKDLDAGGKEKKKRSKDVTYSTSKPEPVGAELLWHQDTVQLYVTVLETCVNATTLAAAGGAIQNLCACAWRPSAEVRSLVRRKMGLPMIVDLLQLQDERAVCAMAWALRNLIIQDDTNRRLVGKYGVANLAALIPDSASSVSRRSAASAEDRRHLEDTVYAALATLADVLYKNAHAAQHFVEKGGVEKTVALTRSRGEYTERTLKMAALVLRRSWQIKSLQRVYRKRGFVQEDFHVTKLEVARSAEDDAFARRNDTLFRQNRPAESDEVTLMRGRRKRRTREEEDEDDESKREETPV